MTDAQGGTPCGSLPGKKFGDFPLAGVELCHPTRRKFFGSLPGVVQKIAQTSTIYSDHSGPCSTIGIVFFPWGAFPGDVESKPPCHDGATPKKKLQKVPLTENIPPPFPADKIPMLVF